MNANRAKLYRCLLLNFGIFAIVCGCRPSSIGQQPYQIISGSMTPTFWGPHRIAVCTRCKQKQRLLVDAYDPGLPSICCLCGQNCEVQQTVLPGDVAEIVSLGPTQGIDRFDMVMIDIGGNLSGSPETFGAADASLHTNRMPNKVLKRVWGLPGETIEFRNGEVWIDGEMLRKSLSQLCSVSVPISHYPQDQVSRWIANHLHGPPLETADVVPGKPIAELSIPSNGILEYRHKRLLRTPNGIRQIDGPFNDDSYFNQSSTQAFHHVCDYMIMLRMRTSFPGDAPSTTESRWSIRIEPANSLVLCCDGPSTHKETAHSISILARTWLRAAICDGRLLAQSDLAEESRTLDPSGHDASQGSSADTRPRIENYSQTPIEIEELTIARDLWLEGEKVQVVAPATSTGSSSGYYLLGDNLPLSIDSRYPEFGRIPRASILGKARSLPDNHRYRR